jgi:hypothetical protein
MKKKHDPIDKAITNYKNGDAERERQRQIKEFAFHLKALKEGF